MCLVYVIAQNIAAINEKSIFRHSSANKITEYNKFPDLCFQGQRA